MRENIRKTMAVCQYLKDKLPEGWEIHSPAGPEHISEDFDNYVLFYKDLKKGTRLGIPIFLNLENPQKSSRTALHTVWGVHEMGYEIWRERERNDGRKRES
jgi:hypothetical protein